MALKGRPLDAAQLARDLDAAELRAENRQRLRPTAIHFPPELPVSQARDAIAAAINANPVIVLCGETGSGKTTQLPKLCLEIGRGSRGLIGHTQPRRLAARSVANRIAQELGAPLGQLVGFETRFDRRTSDQTLIKLMTDGILLAELQRDRDLLAYDTLIIDEAHERSLNIDFLLGWLRELVRRRPDLKVIITSATLDPERLAAHFGGAPILRVEGRAYPVEVRYRPGDADADLETQVADAIDEAWGIRGASDALRRNAGGGDVLVFLPGEREIRDLARSLPGRFPRADILPLYSRLPAQQQDRVFSRGSLPRVVLTTNVAETSITVPGIRYVIDTGTARINRYSPRLGVQQLQIEPISQAAANQRSGRCGRIAAGVCLRLYGEDDFNGRPTFTDPEILRSNLAGVILQMATLNLGDVDAFGWVDAPDNRHVAEGYRLLQTLGALDDNRRLTPLGRQLGRLPLDPRIARIVAAANGPQVDAICVLAAALSVQDPHETPPESQVQARQAHGQWRHPRSDFYSLLNLWTRWQQWNAEGNGRAVRKRCRDHYIAYLRMEEWEAVYRQIVDLVKSPPRGQPAVGTGTPVASLSAEQLESLYPAIHKALAAGLIDHIGLRLPAEKNARPEFQGPKGRKFLVFPGSTLAKKPPLWILSAQLAQTSQLFARVNAEIQPEWLAEVGAHLVKHTVTHPLWNAERGEVQCTEYQSLFGMQLVKRTRHYGSIEPVEARRMFILEGLVRGLWTQKPRFLTDNLQLVSEVEDKEARLRRPDLLGDEMQRFAFYDTRIPADVCTADTLKRWLRHASNDRGDPGRLLKMSETDILRPGADANVENQFPEQLSIDGHPIDLSYRHDPGEEADGVSFHIPLTLLFQLSPERFDWLVPGLRTARIEALIRTLPMALRRLCTPAGHYAEAVAARMESTAGDLQQEVCRHLQAMTGARPAPGDFEIDRLPAYLRPRLLLEDADGKVIAEAETLLALQQRYQGDARAALASAAQADDKAKRWVRAEVTDWDFGDLPEYVSLKGGARGYPSLTIAADGRVQLRVLESAEAAKLDHAAGVAALLLARIGDRMRDLSRTAKSRLGLALVGATHTADELAREVALKAAAAAWPLADIRDPAAFQNALMQRSDFGRAAKARLDDVIGWLLTAAELKAELRALGSRWPGAAEDMRGQLDSLFGHGFIAAIPDALWPRVTIWLRGLKLRIERLPNKPQRDAEALARVAPLIARLPSPFHPARWLIEEWRVALFAQELRAQGSPSQTRIEDALREDVA